MKFNQPIPYKTDDAVLAFCLYIAGIPEFRPPTNSYDEGMLRARGYKGMAFEAAARQEFEKRSRGHVEYWFEAVPKLPFLLKAYNEQRADFVAEGEARDLGDNLRAIMAKAAGRDTVTSEPINAMDEHEALVRIAMTTLKGRIAFVERANDKSAAYLRVTDGAENMTKHDDGSVTVVGQGGSMVPLFASDELKRKMGLK